MLEIKNLDYRVEARPLFDAASARVAAGWKVGLIGRKHVAVDREHIIDVSVRDK